MSAPAKTSRIAEFARAHRRRGRLSGQDRLRHIAAGRHAAQASRCVAHQRAGLARNNAVAGRIAAHVCRLSGALWRHRAETQNSHRIDGTSIALPMPTAPNETHDPTRRSFVDSANAPGCDFPISKFAVRRVSPGARAAAARRRRHRRSDPGHRHGRHSFRRIGRRGGAGLRGAVSQQSDVDGSAGLVGLAAWPVARTKHARTAAARRYVPISCRWRRQR